MPDAMPIQSSSQRIGAIGHKWAVAQIAEHPGWLSRDLTDDFGVDAEAEMTEYGVCGDILKLQFKSSEAVTKSKEGGEIRFVVERKYLDYANQCRYPFIYVVIDITTHEAWYLWLQDWLLQQRRRGIDLQIGQETYSIWVDQTRTLSRGLTGELKDIAKWRGSTQVILSLMDALRAAVSAQSRTATERIIEIICESDPDVASGTLDIIIREATYLGNRMRGTSEGNFVGECLFQLVRRFGGRLTPTAISCMVCRGESYSRTGLIALGLLYDNYFGHISGLNLTDIFLRSGHQEVAYYCALREKHPDKKCLEFMNGPGDFQFSGMRFRGPEPGRFGDKYANRGPSAILDYLVLE